MELTEIVHQELDPEPDPFCPDADPFCPDADSHQQDADSQHQCRGDIAKVNSVTPTLRHPNPQILVFIVQTLLKPFLRAIRT